MQGRLENELKYFAKTEELLDAMPEFVNEWYLYLRSENMTAFSCCDYIRKIRRFLEYIEEDIKSIHVDQITSQTCESYLIYCQTTKLANGMEIMSSIAYQQSVWSVINNFISFLCLKGYINDNYMNNIKRKKKTKEHLDNKQILLTQTEFNKIISTAKEMGASRNRRLHNRNVLILLMFMTTGIKRTAMSEINVENVDLKGHTLSVMGKNNKVNFYYLSDQVMKYLNEWMNDRQHLLKSKSNHALFLSAEGERLSNDSLYYVVRHCCNKALGQEISPQKLRSSFCSILYQQTNDLKLVQNTVGISDIYTVKRYIRHNKDVTNAINNLIKEGE